MKNTGQRTACITPSPVSIICILLFFQLILLGSIPLQAVAGPKGEKGMNRSSKEVSLEKIMETLTKKLDLSQGQIAEVQPIMKDFLMQSKKLKAEAEDSQHSSERGVTKKQMASLIQNTIDQIAVFLSEEQSEKFQELVKSLTRKKDLHSLLGRGSPGQGRQFGS